MVQLNKLVDFFESCADFGISFLLHFDHMIKGDLCSEDLGARDKSCKKRCKSQHPRGKGVCD